MLLTYTAQYGVFKSLHTVHILDRLWMLAAGWERTLPVAEPDD